MTETLPPVPHAPWNQDIRKENQEDQDTDERMVDMVREWAKETDPDLSAGHAVPPPSPVTDAQPREWDTQHRVSMRELMEDDCDEDPDPSAANLLPIRCNSFDAILRLEDKMVLFEDRVMTPGEFESLCGRGTTKKWTVSFRVVEPNGNTGEFVQSWLLRHNRTARRDGKASIKRARRSRFERQGTIPNSQYQMEARVDEELRGLNKTELRARSMKLGQWVPGAMKQEDLVALVACATWNQKGRVLVPVRPDTDPALLWHLVVSLWGEDMAQEHAHELCPMLHDHGVHWVSRSRPTCNAE